MHKLIFCQVIGGPSVSPHLVILLELLKIEIWLLLLLWRFWIEKFFRNYKLDLYFC